MKTATIEELAYIMKEARKDDLPSPIFFLGAGASKSGGIPLACEIITDILDRYPNNPRIKSLKDEEKTYPKLMECLSPNERNKLLKEYIDSCKINVTHIYLAQLMTYGFVDYVLTVSFDNLMLRALALFNEFPSTYDMAILKDLTTTTFKERSVVYLHGQHHGLWLLNTKEEMAKVNEIVPPILHSIKNERPWIFIGYSGEDPIFEHIKGLGRFDNGLYWVTYYEDNPCSTVCKDLLEKSNTNASLIKGYDADSFMLKLNSELELPQPTIIDKPFSSLSSLLNNIVDIDDKEHFKGVKERLEIAKEQVNEAIQQFEEGKVESPEKIQENTEIDLLQKGIIGLMVEEDYQKDKINKIAIKAETLKNAEINGLFADLHFNWGTYLGKLAETKSGDKTESLYNQAFEKYKRAIDIKPDKHEAFNNWGNALGRLAKTKSGDEAESLYIQAIEKFKKAIDIKPDDHDALYNWGTYLGALAETKSGDKAESLYKQAIEKFKKAIDIKPDSHDALYNWGNALGDLAETKSGVEAESLYKQAIGKFKKVIDIKPDSHDAFYNWGNVLRNLAGTKSGVEAESLYKQAIEKYKKSIDIKPDDHEVFNNLGTTLGNLAGTKSGDETETLYNQAFEKYKKAINIKPDYHDAFYNWGNALVDLAKTKLGVEAEFLYKQAFEIFKRAIQLGGSSYNLACLYAMRSEKENALFYLNRSLENKEIEIEFVKDEEDWGNYLEDEDFKKIISLYANP